MALLNKDGIIIIIQFQSGVVGLDQGWLDAPYFLSDRSIPLYILCDLQPRPPPTQFYLYSLQLASSISALAFLDFAAHSLHASMPSLERCHYLS